jgi:3-hydroxyisobutyrate dehydrogenase-like beta-hydroxyacid dehydrogenase
VLGLGLMGREIARRLELGGFELAVYNRSPGPHAEFEERGARVADTPAEAASEAEVLVSMLADGAAVEAVVSGDRGAFSAADGADRTLIEMSTIDLASSRRVAEAAEAAGVGYVRAPVSGNPTVVAAGNLTILLSGDAERIERVRPVLESIGPYLVPLGEGEEARVMKLALNLILAGTTELIAEALVMAEAGGVDRRRALEVMNESVVASRFLGYKVGPLTERDYTATFSLGNLKKDLELIVEQGEESGVPMHVSEVVLERAREAVAAGLDDLDMLALVAKLEHEAGRLEQLPGAGGR